MKRIVTALMFVFTSSCVLSDTMLVYYGKQNDKRMINIYSDYVGNYKVGDKFRPCDVGISNDTNVYTIYSICR